MATPPTSPDKRRVARRGVGALAALVEVVGAEHVLDERELILRYETDWTGAFAGSARAVVRPGSAAEVAAVVKICAAERIAIVPQGGNTGLVGGSVPDGTGTAIVLSTSRLRELSDISLASAQLTAGAGVTLGDVQRHVRPAGYDVAVDLGARDSATIGGMVATNAGGIRVLRHGMMRRQVAGLEAVLGNGDVVSHLGGLEKDNTGYDLAALLTGSEGTLGIVTRVRLKLVPVDRYRVTALLAWPDLTTMVAGLMALRAAVPDLDAAEYMVRRGTELVRGQFGTPDPFPTQHEAYLLIEAAGSADPTASLAAAIDQLSGLEDVAVADSERHRQQLWALRELHTEALTKAGPPHKVDVTVPIDTIPRFVDDVITNVERAGTMTCHHFGHLGDGNVHLNILGPQPDEGVIFGLVRDYGGSISAEHGIGRLKRTWLHLSRSPAEIEAYTAIKRALDPAGILNPGVLLTATG